jgi:hypothetical protein
VVPPSLPPVAEAAVAIKLTMDTYSHVLEGMQGAMTEAMDLALGSSRFGQNFDTFAGTATPNLAVPSV